MQLPKRDFDRPLILAEVPQGIGCKPEGFADAHSGCPHQEDTVRAHVVIFSELLIELLVIFRRERLREVLISMGEIPPNQEVLSNPAVACGQIVEQTPNL
jgi:hypothetical protein